MTETEIDLRSRLELAELKLAKQRKTKAAAMRRYRAKKRMGAGNAEGESLSGVEPTVAENTQ